MTISLTDRVTAVEKELTDTKIQVAENKKEIDAQVALCSARQEAKDRSRDRLIQWIMVGVMVISVVITLVKSFHS